jgi:hypothetical protein
MIKYATTTNLVEQDYDDIVWAIQRIMPDGYHPIFEALIDSVSLQHEIADMEKWQDLIDIGLIVRVCQDQTNDALAGIPLVWDLLKKIKNKNIIIGVD